MRETCWMGSAGQQAGDRVRFDWGVQGAGAIAGDADVTVVVDILSFTTTVTVAADMGMAVVPYRWGDRVGAERLAAERGAVLAVGRSAAGVGQPSLSPLSIRTMAPARRLVLPSPNGSTLAYRLAGGGRTGLAACLRNATATAQWISARHGADHAAVAVLAAGERWSDGSLRPAVEDLWGAGAEISALRATGWTALSAEAVSAAAAYDAVAGRELEALLSCVSGHELLDGGFAGDVEVAAELDSSTAVPCLIDDEFGPG